MVTFHIYNLELETKFMQILNNNYNGDFEQAIQELIEIKRAKNNNKKSINFLKYSGILKDMNIDGLEFQDKVRSEWD